MGPVSEADIERASRLPHRVVVLLVDGAGEHARIGFEDECGAVSVMDVEIDDGDAFNTALLQHADGDGNVVERTESFAVIWKSVVQAAAGMTHDSAGTARARGR